MEHSHVCKRDHVRVVWYIVAHPTLIGHHSVKHTLCFEPARRMAKMSGVFFAFHTSWWVFCRHE